jgi:hypothetical protein
MDSQKSTSIETNDRRRRGSAGQSDSRAMSFPSRKVTAHVRATPETQNQCFDNRPTTTRSRVVQQRGLGRVIVVNAMLSPMVSHDLVHNAAYRCAEVLRETCTLSDETKLLCVVVQWKARTVMTLHRLLPAPRVAQALPQGAKATTPRLFIRPVTAPHQTAAMWSSLAKCAV